MLSAYAALAPMKLRLVVAVLLARPACTWLPTRAVPHVALPSRAAPNVHMAKGDGKQRRKKKEDLPPAP